MRSLLCLAALGVTGAFADLSDLVGGDPAGFEDSHDLHNFITRPELKAPRYMVAKHHPEAITPGYWFVTPYSTIIGQHRTPRREHIPCQTGPHIYDGDGILIWSGACEYGNRDVFNFRPVTIGGVQHFSLWLPKKVLGDIQDSDRESVGVLMNTLYQEVNRTYVRDGRFLDGHEYNVLRSGKTVIYSTIWTTTVDASSLGQGERAIWNGGFQEVDIETGAVLFDWVPTDGHVALNESCDVVGMDPEYKPGKAWDWFHINSVDKTLSGDYIVSSRHTHTIYKISKDDGSVIWKLGGCGGSDFEMEEGLEFHWQHHARIRHENMTHSVISLFDNHGDDQERNPGIPNGRTAAKVVILDHSTQPMTAKMLRRFDRPDGDTSVALGSVQMMGKTPETSSFFIDWAFPGYISEYDSQNRLVMEAKWMSERFRSYRAYKGSFVGRPTEAPAFKILPIAYGKEGVATAFYVSWNGATEVAEWAFYGGDSLTGSLKRLGIVEKRGFETSWVMTGVARYAYAEALDKSGKSLGRSATVTFAPGRDLEEPYHVATPLLDNINLQDPAYRLTPPTPEVPGYPVYTEPVPEKEDVATHSAASKAVSTAKGGAPYFFIVAFAAYGGFVAVRNLIHEVTRRRQRRGYKSVSGLEG